MKYFILLASLFFCSACAVLHHVQVGNIDNSDDMDLIPFEIKVSEFGLNLNDAKAISTAVLNSKDSKQANDALAFIQYFQMGPHTGAGVFSVAYANHLEQKIYEQCPSGRITGVMSIRESREYPVIKGEIIKIKGFCMRSKKERL